MKKTTLVTLALIFTLSLFTSCAGTSTPNSDLPRNTSSQVAETSITSTAIVEAIPEVTTEPSVEATKSTAIASTNGEIETSTKAILKDERFEINTQTSKLLKFNNALTVSDFHLNRYGSMMTSIASLVNYYGYEETPFSLFEYFEKEEIVPNPDNFVPDWDYVYCGTNLYEKNYGCGALPVANALNSFFENSNFEVRNLYEEFDPDIYKYINYGYPVAVWCCENLTSFEDNNYTVNIRHVPYKYYSELETIAILVGYDEENVFLIFSDNSEVQKFSKEIFEKNFAECDGKAVVIIRK